MIYRPLITLLLGFALCACTRNGGVMNKQRFEELEIGMSWETTVQLVGEPVEVKQTAPHDFEAIYLVREGDGLHRAWRTTLRFESDLLISSDTDLMENYGPNF